MNRKRVLFVCFGNACRSQMAEGFARLYGSDVMVPASAGLAPATAVARHTRRAMEEKNVDLDSHFPKGLKQWGRVNFDLVINMSGVDLPEGLEAPVRIWDVPDPVTRSYRYHCEIRDRIERLVMDLILELRREAP